MKHLFMLVFLSIALSACVTGSKSSNVGSAKKSAKKQIASDDQMVAKYCNELAMKYKKKSQEVADIPNQLGIELVTTAVSPTLKTKINKSCEDSFKSKADIQVNPSSAWKLKLISKHKKTNRGPKELNIVSGTLSLWDSNKLILFSISSNQRWVK